MSDLAVNGGVPVRQVPFATWPPVSRSAVDAVSAALADGVWSAADGPRKVLFEERFAQFQDAGYGVAVSNGTVALQLALTALGVGPGDEVIVPAYTFVATATSVLAVGATPVFVDVSPGTATIDPTAVEAAVTPRTRVIMPVHFAGHPADLDALSTVAERHLLAIVEDAAQAHGARWRDRGVGSTTAFGSFSFQATKNLTAGEGGILVTSDPELAELAWSLHHCGRERGRAWYEHVRVGGNHRMTEFQAALLLDQLDRADEWMDRRESTADLVVNGLTGILAPLDRDPRCTRHAYHLLVFNYDGTEFGGISRERFLEALNAEGIPAMGGYDLPVHRQPAFGAEADTPVSDRLCRGLVWFPQTILLSGPEGAQSVLDAVAKVQHAALAGELT